MKRILPILFSIFVCSLAASAQTASTDKNSNKTQEFKSTDGSKKVWSKSPFDYQVFVDNEGQFTADLKNGDKILYGTQDGDVFAFITNHGIVYKYTEYPHAQPDDKDKDAHKAENKNDPDNILPPVTHYLTATWVGGSGNMTAEAGEQQTYYCTYPGPNNKGTITAHAFKTVTCKNVYPGIDVEFTFPEGKAGFKYTLVVHPGADLSVVKLKYDGAKDMSINADGDVEINSGWGSFTDHAPVTYCKEDPRLVTSGYKLNDNEESFNIGDFDVNKTLMIDPWTTNWSKAYAGNSGYDGAYDVDYDYAGNVYAYGGHSPFQLVKYNSAGTQQWVYSTSNFTEPYYGDFAVDKKSGISFALEGFGGAGGAMTDKISLAGALLATYNGNSNMNEQWRASYDLCDNVILIAGGGINSSEQAAILDTNMLTYTYANVMGLPAGHPYHDMALIATDPFSATGYMATTTSSSLDGLEDNYVIKMPLPGMVPTNFNVADGYAFDEVNSITYAVSLGTANGMNGMAVSPNWYYMYDGKKLEKRNKATGALVSSVTIGATQYGWGGCDADICDNVYIGNNTTIYEYNSALGLVNTYGPMSGTIYDVVLSKGEDSLYVSGAGFVASISLNNPPNEKIVKTRTNAACGCTGTASAQLTFCGNVYTTGVSYLWSTGATTSSITVLCAGTYTITMKIGCLFDIQDTVLIKTTGGSLAIATTQVNATCGVLGSATANPSGGTAPYTYSWNPTGQTNQTATGLSAGCYTVTVHDNAGCSVTASVCITQSATINLTITPTNPLCNGGLGSIIANPAGGTAPYTYSWNPTAQTNQTATGLSVGCYTVTVHDNNGCSATASACITQPTLLTATMGAPTDPLCNGGTGSLTVTAGGGTVPYTYSWAPNGGSNASATGLSVGCYTVTVKDNKGCSATASACITQPPLLTANITAVTYPPCNGQTGSATVTAGGGTGAYTYTWAPNGGSNAIGTGLTVGSYTVTVKDANGCIATASVNITQPAAITTAMSSTPASCNLPNGSVTVLAGGGSAPYTYAWIPVANTNATATGLTAGCYTVTVTDNKGCTVTASVCVTQPPAVTANITTITNVPCNGGIGSLTVTAGGGTAPYTYLWAPGGQTNATATGLTAGCYTVTVHDNNGCVVTTSACITQPALLTATMGAPTDPLCNGGVGSANVTAGGGTIPYTYLWAPNGGTNALGTGLTAGSYTVTVHDNNGCVATASVTITQPPLLTATMGVPTYPLCNGGTGSVTVTAGGGTGAYTYSWAPNGGSNAMGTGLTAGSYTVTVTDNNGCIATASVTITQPAPITAGTSFTPASCNLPNGSTTVLAGGGTAPYTYAWNPSGNSNATATGLSAGCYTVTVTDHDGCSVTASVCVTQPSAITASISGSTGVSCNGGSNGTATANAVGGTAPYTYSWSTVPVQTNQTATGLSAGSYTVTVTDNNGCISTASVTITQPPVLTATMGVPSDPFCNGGTGSATVTAGGGTIPYTYAWTPIGGVGATGTGLTAGSYTVTVTDNNGCTATASVTITQPPLLTATMGVPINILCNGGTGSISVTAGGGTGAYTYSWAPSGGSNANATGLTAGCYTVTVKDNNGCVATASACVTQPTALTAATSFTQASCNLPNGSTTVLAGGGTAPYTYAWNPSGNTNATATGLSAGCYTVTVTDNNACTITASICVTQPSAVVATIPTNTSVSCFGGNNATATGSGAGGTAPYTYSWSTVPVQTNATATGLTAGSYTVTVTDNNGCSSTASVAITQPTLLTATMGVSTDPLCNGGTGTAIVTAGGGTLNYSYAWTPSGGNGATGTGLTAGSYTVTVTDANGCTATASVTITQPTLLTANITASTNVLCNGGTGTATVSAGGGTGAYTYSWAPTGGTNATGTGMIAGSYTITVKDNNGCIATASVTITQPALLAVTTTFTHASCSLPNGTATANPAGGTPNYIYSWSTAPAQTNQTATGLLAGSYTVTVTDANGCTASTAVTVTQPSAVTATIAGTTGVSCKGGNNGTITSVAGGGSPNYTYIWAPGANTNATATGLTAGIYTVTITDANGCTATASATVTEPPVLGVTIQGPQIICLGSTGIYTATVTGGTAPYAYSWSTGQTTSTASETPLIPSSYTVTITDAHGCTATADVSTNFGPPISVVISGNPAVCNGRSTTLCAVASGGTGGNVYQWSPGGATTACITLTPASNTTYTLTVTDNCGASASASVNVIINPYPAINFYADVYQGCSPLCVQFRNATNNAGIGGSTQYTWSLGNGDTLQSQNPIFCYTHSGAYDITLTVTSDSGCSATLKKVNLINVFGPPIASFTYSPQPTTILNPTIQFTDNSTDAYGLAYWFWTFGDATDSTSYLRDPSHTYLDTGTYCPRLVVMDIHGCTDTTTNCLAIAPAYALYIPSAFSPNGDGVNETFQPKGQYIQNFDMYIFDRWGMKLYHTTDINQGWNGTVTGGTTIAQEDTYVYLITVIDSQGNQHKYIGRVTLLK